MRAAHHTQVALDRLKMHVVGGARRSAAVLAGLLVTVALATPTVASAANRAPHWAVMTLAAPTDFHPGDTSDFYETAAVNDGGTETAGPITMTDTLPPGVVVNAITAYVEVQGLQQTRKQFIPSCQQTISEGATTVTCETGTGVPTGRSLNLNLNVEISAGAEPGEILVNTATITGGGAQTARVSGSTPVTESVTPVPFGAVLATDVAQASGAPDTQAGSHPFAFTTLLAFNSGSVDPTERCNENQTPSCAKDNAVVKDIEVALPPGVVGNPTATPRCSQTNFEEFGDLNCPASTQVGSVYTYFYGNGTIDQWAPVYNIQAPPGQPAELGFTVGGKAHIPMFFHVRSDGDYGITADISLVNQFNVVRMGFMTLWGNPSDEVHDPLRSSSVGCIPGHECPCLLGCPSGVPSPKPFLTMPTSCAAPLSISLAGDSWQSPEPAPFAPLAQSSLPESSSSGMTGCEALQFHPSLAVKASTHQAGAPAGYDVDLKVPQNEEIEGLATPDVRDVEVALPQGTTISPSSANGLLACSEAQFQPKKRSVGDCPGAAKVATVKVTSPLLTAPLTGSLYLAEPECSPCTPAQSANGQMVHLYMEAAASGVVVKLAGHTRIDQASGQLTAVFTDNPQLPFSDLQVSLESGPDASLENPATCGGAVATAHLTPWSSSSAVDILAPAIPIQGCAAQAFSPSIAAGTTNTARGGAFTGFHASLSRQDGEQTLGRVSVTTPPGLLGVLKSVVQCPEAQANAGTCASSSQIGTGSIVLGPGTQPLTVTGSKVYLTGPYHGAPFGLSIVTPTQAGPFVLSGNTGQGTEVVRASIEIDRSTGALTIASDALPQSLNGVTLNIRTVNIDVNREGFMFSPTNCDAMSVNGTFASPTGTLAHVSYPFQAQNCALLPFHPVFAASTVGRASKRDGAALDVKVTSKGGPQAGGGEANIAKVKVALPIQLPSRLSTLQRACTDAQFKANPANCPKESDVGTATATTPLLANPLSGPAYLVSQGGAAFPDLEIVLQGEGITLTLDGKTDIKKGITTSTFDTVPDAPISSFELKLPTGPFSVLGAFVPIAKRYSLCGQNLRMPTTITGQNGAVLTQKTKITTTGCAKPAKAAMLHASRSGRHHKRRPR